MIVVGATLAMVGAVGCAADRGGDDLGSTTDGALSIPPEHEKAAAWACEKKAEQLAAKNGAVFGSFEACVASGARVACTKDGDVMPGTYRTCNCENDIGSDDIKTTVQCNANYASTDDRCDKLSMNLEYVGQYYFAEPTPGYADDPKTYLNWIKLHVQNDGDKAISVDRNYKHIFRCSGELPDQRMPLTIQPGSNDIDIVVRYTEEEFGREFLTNTSRIELDCGGKTIAKSLSWTRTRDASDPGPTTCQPGGGR